MRAQLKALARPAWPWIDRVQEVLKRLVKLLFRAWKRVNSLDIPLSPLQWILLLYIVFGFSYTAASPVFEANDELWHFGFLQHLRETGSLPIQEFDGKETVYAQHGSQPPLYYALSALLTAPFDIDDIDEYRRLNPHVRASLPNAYGNKNLIIHDASLSLLRGAGFAVLLLRLFGLALGAGTIVLVYKISEFVAPQRPTVAFVAAALTGLNPMFIFISASVSNDSLAMILNGALLLLLLRCLRDGFRPRNSLFIALLFALTSISKVTSLVLLPALLLVGSLVLYRTRDRRGAMIYFIGIAVFWMLVAAWWYLRNLQLYNEPFGMMTMANIAGPRGMTFSLVNLFSEFQQFRMSYWGLFGALNIQLSAIYYLLLDLMTLTSFAGCIFLILQLLAISDFAYARYELRHLALLLMTVFLLLIGVLYWSTLTYRSDGRILFPLIAAISPALAVGFVEMIWWIVFSLRPPNLEFVRAGDAVPKELLHETMVWQLRILGLAAMLAPFTVIAGQYAAPEPMSAAPENARPVYAEFGDVALIAYERLDRRYSPGDKVRVKLYWQVLEQSQEDNSVFLTFVDDHKQEIGHYVTYPGAGALRTSQWEKDAIYADEYLITIHSAATGRYPFELQVEWEDLAGDKSIIATNAEGDDIHPVLLDIGAVVSARLQDSGSGFIEIPVDMQPNFDESIRLERYLVDSDLNELVLHWKAESAPAEDYTVFVHMLDEEGKIIAQADLPPRLPTKYWRWGETYSTYHQLPAELPLLDYAVSVGWYINDGLAYPKIEYRHQIEGDAEEEAPEEIFLDSFVVPWEMLIESVRLTEEAEATAEAGDTEGAAGEEASGEPAASASTEASDGGN
ncbi:MAG: DUF2142 domain-containing protein [Chloroflexota bacterium]|nr:DUF2142 domain-containing protein [Chloroflexota bacterium]